MTQQRHAKALREAAVGFSKITNFFNVKTPSGDPSESNDEDDWENPINDDRKKVDASELVAVSLGREKVYKERCIRAWAKQWIQNKTLTEPKRGKHSNTKCLWNVTAQIVSHA
ncbi:6811_t:CDS:2 [Entrophospora sp. SA101]|nr:6811_t:CDS:2 [Entrophospora sp. SA101]